MAHVRSRSSRCCSNGGCTAVFRSRRHMPLACPPIHRRTWIPRWLVRATTARMSHEPPMTIRASALPTSTASPASPMLVVTSTDRSSSECVIFTHGSQQGRSRSAARPEALGLPSGSGAQWLCVVHGENRFRATPFVASASWLPSRLWSFEAVLPPSRRRHGDSEVACHARERHWPCDGLRTRCPGWLPHERHYEAGEGPVPRWRTWHKGRTRRDDHGWTSNPATYHWMAVT